MVLLGCQRESSPSPSPKGPLIELRQSLQKADRIVVSHVDKKRHYLISKAKAHALMEQVHLSGFRNYFQCICYSDMVFYVYRGDELLEVFAYFEEGAFAWHQADWSGDAELTMRSHDTLSMWFHEVLPGLDLLPEGSFIPPPID